MCISNAPQQTSFLNSNSNPFGIGSNPARAQEEQQVNTEYRKALADLGMKEQRSSVGSSLRPQSVSDNPGATRGNERGSAEQQLSILRGQALADAAIRRQTNPSYQPTVQRENYDLSDKRQRDRFASQFGAETLAQYDRTVQERSGGGDAVPTIIGTSYTLNRTTGGTEAQDIIVDSDGGIYRGITAAGNRAMTTPQYGPPPAAAWQQAIGVGGKARSQTRIATSAGQSQRKGTGQ